MKYAVSTYSFAGYLSPEDSFEKAKELGFDALEIADIPDNYKDEPEKFANIMARKSKETGIKISNFAVAADFVNRDTKAEIARIKKIIDFAEIMGAPSVRHDVMHGLGKYRSFGLALPLIADACREITEYAAAKNIRTMTENHGIISQDSYRLEQLFNAVHHSNFGILIDIGNFLCVDESPIDAVSRLAPYAFYVHAKDFLVKSGSEANPGRGFFKSRGENYLRGTIIGQGAVPVKQCIDIMKAAGYNGYITVEYEGMEPKPLGIEIGLENLKAYVE